MPHISDEQLAAVRGMLRAHGDELRSAHERLQRAFECRACNGVGKRWGYPPLQRWAPAMPATIEACAVCHGLGSSASVDPYTGRLSSG